MPDESNLPQPERHEPPSSSGWNVLSPDESRRGGVKTARVTTGGGRDDWQPPTLEEAATLFPGYEVRRLLGRGGMGAVYQARQIELDRLVAIKLLPLQISVDREFADRFRREARAMARLNHPNIVTVHDFGTTSSGHLFFAMEFVDGANLAAIIYGEGLDPTQALSIAEQVCTALGYAHTKGIVHRDIKPANVMVDTEGHVKVADFGLARLAGPSTEQLGHTVTGTVMGTPDYMAPEQMEGMNVDHRADIYSLGVMLYEMLCQQVPKGNFDPPSRRTGCDARIDAIVLRAIQQSPARRYQSALEMKTDVITARTPLPILPSHPGGTEPSSPEAGLKTPSEPLNAIPQPAPGNADRLKSRSRRNRWRAIAGVAGAAVIVVGSVIILSRGNATKKIPSSAPGATSTQSALATTPPPAKRKPPQPGRAWKNILGMMYNPIDHVWMATMETRVHDFEAFVQETHYDATGGMDSLQRDGLKNHGRSWQDPGFNQSPEHPVVGVSREDAKYFCKWLTDKEHAAGALTPEQIYRLPTDREWSDAVGLPAESGATPEERSGKIKGVYPWGLTPTPPESFGNYAGLEAKEGAPDNWPVIAGYKDPFPRTCPVPGTKANVRGFYDLGGNVWEWCDDNYGGKTNPLWGVLRGGSWATSKSEEMLSSYRKGFDPSFRADDVGFRCVIAIDPAVATPVPATRATATPGSH